MEDSTVTITDGSPVKATKVYLWWCCYFVLCAVCCRILSVIVLRLHIGVGPKSRPLPLVYYSMQTMGKEID